MMKKPVFSRTLAQTIKILAALTPYGHANIKLTKIIHGGIVQIIHINGNIIKILRYFLKFKIRRNVEKKRIKMD